MSNYSQQLENAARLTGRLVEGLASRSPAIVDAALKDLMYRRGVGNELEAVKRGDSEVWQELVGALETRAASVLGMGQT